MELLEITSRRKAGEELTLITYTNKDDPKIKGRANLTKKYGINAQLKYLSMKKSRNTKKAQNQLEK